MAEEGRTQSAGADVSLKQISLARFSQEFKEGLQTLQNMPTSENQREVYVMLMLSDRFDILKYSGQDDIEEGKECFYIFMNDQEIKEIYEKALEVRLFHEDGEIKWFRSSIDRELYKREKLNDCKLQEADYWDEEQYLDIDKKRSETPKLKREGKVQATGGGEYTLPISDYQDLKVCIRNYLDYEPDSGRVYIKDWRIVKFTKGEK